MNKTTIITFLFFLSFQLFANDVAVNYSLDLYSSYKTIKIENSFIESHDQFFNNDLRFGLDLLYKNSQLIMRPRGIFNLNLENTSAINDRFFFDELYFSHKFTDSFELFVGKQSFQWGPAELISWSNNVFHFNVNSRSFFYKEEGRNLVRVNYFFSRNTSLVLLGEMFNEDLNNDSDLSISEKKFDNTLLAKVETIFENPANYLGVTLSTSRYQTKNLGIYNNFELYEGTSFYTDSRLSLNQQYYQLKDNASYFSWVINEKRDKLEGMFLGGLRLESSVDFRLEYIYNSIGLTSKSLKNALTTIHPLNPNNQRNLKILNSSGREIIGEHYLYSSLRIPNLGKSDDLTLFFRHLYSFQDYSQTFAFLLEKNISDQTVGYLEFEKSIGKINSELRLNSVSSYLLGLKLSL